MDGGWDRGVQVETFGSEREEGGPVEVGDGRGDVGYVGWEEEFVGRVRGAEVGCEETVWVCRALRRGVGVFGEGDAEWDVGDYDEAWM